MPNPLRWFVLLLFCSTFLFFSQAITAQSPETQRAVLADLSRRTGQTPEFNNFSSWNWSFGTYSYVINQGGCAAAPATAPTTGDWQRYNIVFQGTTYNYIVADNTQSVILCNESTISIATVAPTTPPRPTAAATVTLPPPAVPTVTAVVPTAVCQLPTQLEVGASARVLPGEPNWVHEQSNRNSTKIGEIPADGVARVLQGPICDAQSGMNYWQVEYEGLTGWTSEGLPIEYWLDPVAGRFAISATNANLVGENTLEATITQRHPNGVTAMVFTPDSGNLVTADAAGNIQIWDIVDNQTGDTVQHPGGVASMALNTDSTLLATGGLENSIYIWLRSDQAITEQSRIITGGRVGALAFATAGLLAAANPDGSVALYNVQTTPPTLLATLPSKGLVDQLEFSPDGSLLMARSTTSGLVRVWSVQSAS